MFLLNWAPAPTFDFDYEVGGDYEYPADDPASSGPPDEEHDDDVKSICDIVGSRSGKYAFTHLRGELFLFHGKAS